jgi:hypothetical protein
MKAGKKLKDGRAGRKVPRACVCVFVFVNVATIQRTPDPDYAADKVDVFPFQGKKLAFPNDGPGKNDNHRSVGLDKVANHGLNLFGRQYLCPLHLFTFGKVKARDRVNLNVLPLDGRIKDTRKRGAKVFQDRCGIVAEPRLAVRAPGLPYGPRAKVRKRRVRGPLQRESKSWP